MPSLLFGAMTSYAASRTNTILLSILVMQANKRPLAFMNLYKSHSLSLSCARVLGASILLPIVAVNRLCTLSPHSSLEFELFTFLLFVAHRHCSSFTNSLSLTRNARAIYDDTSQVDELCTSATQDGNGLATSHLMTTMCV